MSVITGTVRWTIGAVLVVAAGPLVAAQDWTGWRGPELLVRDATSLARLVPADQPPD